MAVKFIREKWFYLLLLAVSLALPLVITDRYIFQIIIMSMVFSIATLSMNLILGYTGQASLAHAGFFAIGAYGLGIMTKAGLSFWLALPAASLLSALVGFIIGLPTLRTRGSYFAIVTLCFGVIVYIVIGNLVEITGGQTGLLGIPLPQLGGLVFNTHKSQYYLVLAFLLLTLFVMHRLVYSLLGLGFMSVRNNEALAESLGINTFATKIISFMTANFFAGMAGGIYASLMGSISPSVASFSHTFFWLVYLMLGGVATLAGPIIGAFAIPVLMEYLQFLQEYRLIIFGALLIIIIMYFPRGLMGGINSLRDKLSKAYKLRKTGGKDGITANK